MGGLPRGQRPAQLRRFGLPQFAGTLVEPGPRPVLTIGGLVRRPLQVGITELLATAPRVTRQADLHCVTTWTATGLRWSGVRFADLYASLSGPVRPHPAARWVTAVGLDGYRSCLLLDDLLAPDVLVADELDDRPLGPAHGAPARLVLPAHYGYKSVKYLCALEFRHDYEHGSVPRVVHRRGRVAREERGRWLPGMFWRPLWRALVPPVRRRYQEQDEIHQREREASPTA